MTRIHDYGSVEARFDVAASSPWGSDLRPKFMCLFASFCGLTLCLLWSGSTLAAREVPLSLSQASPRSSPSNLTVITSSRDGLRFEHTYAVLREKNSDRTQNSMENSKDLKSSVVLRIHADVKYQTIAGFGGAFTESSAYNLGLLSQSKQEEVLDAYFGDPDTSLGYTLGRVHINSCDYSLASYSCDDTPGDLDLKDFNIDHDHIYLLPMVKRALHRLRKADQKLKLFASPWSPPAWMKGNGQMDQSSDPGLLPDPAIHDAWARYLSKWVSMWQQEDVEFWGLTVQNEPLNNAPWEACVYSKEQQRDFIKDHLGPVLKKDHPHLQLIIFDHNRDFVQDWAETILNSDAAQYVAGTGVHWYEGNSPSLRHYENLDKTHAIAPDKFILATEATYCPGVQLGDWTRGEAYSHDILNDLNHWAVGWTDWNLLLDMSGGPNHLGNKCDAPVLADAANDDIVLQPFYFHIGHFSKYIRPGAIRVKHSLSHDLECRPASDASAGALCAALCWALGEQQQWDAMPDCNAATSDPIAEAALRTQAKGVFGRWYQAHKEDQGPYACDFGGTAILQGVQATAFRNEDRTMVVVLLNKGDTPSTVLLDTDQGTSSIAVPPHAITTLVWPLPH